MNNNPLDKFIEYFESIKMTIQEKKKMRDHLASFVVSYKPKVSPYHHIIIMARRGLVISFITLLSIGSISNVISIDALPGDTLYPIKIGHENLRVATTMNTHKKINYEIKRTEKRIKEAIILASNNNLDTQTQKNIAKEIKKQAKKVTNHIKEVKEQDLEEALVLSSKLKSTIEINTETLKQISTAIKHTKKTTKEETKVSDSNEDIKEKQTPSQEEIIVQNTEEQEILENNEEIKVSDSNEDIKEEQTPSQEEIIVQNTEEQEILENNEEIKVSDSNEDIKEEQTPSQEEIIVQNTEEQEILENNEEIKVSDSNEDIKEKQTPSQEEIIVQNTEEQEILENNEEIKVSDSNEDIKEEQTPSQEEIIVQNTEEQEILENNEEIKVSDSNEDIKEEQTPSQEEIIVQNTEEQEILENNEEISEIKQENPKTQEKNTTEKIRDSNLIEKSEKVYIDAKISFAETLFESIKEDVEEIKIFEYEITQEILEKELKDNYLNSNENIQENQINIESQKETDTNEIIEPPSEVINEKIKLLENIITIEKQITHLKTLIPEEEPLQINLEEKTKEDILPKISENHEQTKEQEISIPIEETIKILQLETPKQVKEEIFFIPEESSTEILIDTTNVIKKILFDESSLRNKVDLFIKEHKYKQAFIILEEILNYYQEKIIIQKVEIDSGNSVLEQKQNFPLETITKPAKEISVSVKE